MATWLRTLCSICLVFVATPGTARADAQATPPQDQAAAPAQNPSQRLRVYLDCRDCFDDYLRDEIDWVDFVRQPQDADVHLLSSSQGTGGGGRETVLRFVGAGRFDGVDMELKALSLTGDTENVRRETILRTVGVGLLGYLARLGLPAGLDVDVSASERRADDQAPAEDRWNLWVFEIGADASLNAEESNRESEWQVDFSGDRVTELWKVSFGISAEERSETFDLDEDDPFEVTQLERSVDWFVARSLGPHWSLGLDGRVESSTFGNTRFSAQAAPAIEFSVFPYEQYATRQFRFQYQIGVERAEYNEITLFDKFEETLGRHELSANLDQRQPWGSLEAGLELSQYLHDLGLYRLEVDGELSIRITRGLSVDIEGGASRIRDQLSLPRRDATPEEVLLRLRELQSGYDVRFSVGVSYSFGSIYNNIVNPRFGGGGGGGGGF
jgi:hypothetical protein